MRSAPGKVLAALLATAVVISVAATVAQQLDESRDELWEFACPPESTLTGSALDFGLKAVRKNLANGYDISQLHLSATQV